MLSMLVMRHTSVMHTSESLYHRHRFTSEIISHCVWLYFRVSLSFRDVEEILATRGVTLTYETVREWCLKFGHSHQPTRLREKVMRRFKSVGHAQRFLSAFGLSRHISELGDTFTRPMVIEQ
jgi:transposase-like protein